MFFNRYPRHRKPRQTAIAFALLLLPLASRAHAQNLLKPGSRTLVDCHNCYPYNDQWKDRIDRALQTGVPVGIEQDLAWYRDPKTGAGHSVLSHEVHLKGTEPTLESYFFATVRPIIEKELSAPHPERWPLITLNLDFKTRELDHLRAIRSVLEQHKEWLTTAPVTANASKVQKLHAGPILVLVGPSEEERQVFSQELSQGSSLLAFGAVPVHAPSVDTDPKVMETDSADNYHRWWNNSWTVVERGGAAKAGEWQESSQERLKQMIEQAHHRGLWIRFYTLDAATPEQQKAQGLFSLYNFKTPEQRRDRVQTLFKLHADWIATDEVEQVKQITERQQ